MFCLAGFPNASGVISKKKQIEHLSKRGPRQNKKGPWEGSRCQVQGQAAIIPAWGDIMCYPILDNLRKIPKTKVLFSGPKAALALYSTTLHPSTLVNTFCLQVLHQGWHHQKSNLRRATTVHVLLTQLFVSKVISCKHKGVYFSRQLVLTTWDMFDFKYIRCCLWH